MDECEAIVRALAAENPFNDRMYCVLCGFNIDDYHNDHKAECAYRRARDWVSGHPGPIPERVSHLGPWPRFEEPTPVKCHTPDV